MRRLEELTWPELAALDRTCAVVFVPISPMEEHGPHLPIGTDLFVARALCERTALEIERRLPDVTTLLAPAVPIGSGVIPMFGSLGVRQRVVQDTLLAVGRSLARDGFRTIVVLTGHLGLTHLWAMRVAAARVSRRFGVSMLAPALEVGRAALSGAETGALFAQLDPPLTLVEQAAFAMFHHAGTLETSVMLHLHPELVQPLYQALPPLGRLAYLGWWGRKPGRFQGYVGQPAQARADAGGVAVAALVGAAADLVEQALARQAIRREAASRSVAHRPSRRALRPVWVGTLGALSMAGVAAVAARRWHVRWPGTGR